MNTETRFDGDEFADNRRHIDAMKEAFASAVEARQAELRALEGSSQPAGWRSLLFRKPQ